ncbi:hypothetical protein QTO34_004343 [Cnephaeus nilssonii]|uniref:Uncharacterized protein n=1 Tax=Cnephaeus nilssonii TaxID=3371016 RepID=A0AA40HQ08_CNENI|nr:hypothetical protein QTO34_004343 [Eptesicus nilssonii]
MTQDQTCPPRAAGKALGPSEEAEATLGEASLHLAHCSVLGLTCTHMALSLHDEEALVTEDKGNAHVTGVNVEPSWPRLFAKALANVNVGRRVCSEGPRTCPGSWRCTNSRSCPAASAATRTWKQRQNLGVGHDPGLVVVADLFVHLQKKLNSEKNNVMLVPPQILQNRNQVLQSKKDEYCIHRTPARVPGLGREQERGVQREQPQLRYSLSFSCSNASHVRARGQPGQAHHQFPRVGGITPRSP